MSKSELVKEWLFGNSIIALVGAFLWGTAWRPTASTDPDWLFVSIGIFLVFAALFFAFTSVVPLCRNQASILAIYCSPILKLLAFAGFIASWGSAAHDWPEGQWWTGSLIIGGTLLLPIILVKFVQDFHRWASRDSFDLQKSVDTETSGEERHSGGLALGFIIILMVVLISISRPVLLRLWQRSSSR